MSRFVRVFCFCLLRSVHFYCLKTNCGSIEADKLQLNAHTPRQKLQLAGCHNDPHSFTYSLCRTSQNRVDKCRNSQFGHNERLSRVCLERFQCVNDGWYINCYANSNDFIRHDQFAAESWEKCVNNFSEELDKHDNDTMECTATENDSIATYYL